MIKVLSIGNSFSQDAQSNLHQISVLEGTQIECVNLYIGGCSLETHYRNLRSDSLCYGREENGRRQKKTDSIIHALESDKWDFVTLQQVSHLSQDFNSYMPYLQELAQCVRELAPQAKILMHQTWAYEQGSERLTEELGYRDQHEMLEQIQSAYQKAAQVINSDGTIPCGVAMMNAIDAGLKVHRDTFHADLNVGRYLLGLTWYACLTNTMEFNGNTPENIHVTDEELRLIRKAVRDAVLTFK